MRPIDAYALNNALVSLYNNTEDETEKSILRRVMQMVVHAPTLPQPSNEPLTPEELREMDGEPVYVVSAIGERPEWYIVDIEENEFKNPWDSISLENWDEGYPYTAYRRPPEREADGK